MVPAWSAIGINIIIIIIIWSDDTHPHKHKHNYNYISREHELYQRNLMVGALPKHRVPLQKKNEKEKEPR